MSAREVVKIVLRLFAAELINSAFVIIVMLGFFVVLWVIAKALFGF